VRILILGGDGMLGHQLFKSYQGRHDVRVTLHRGIDEYASYKLFSLHNSYPNVDVLNFDQLTDIAKAFRPEAIINAVGIVKQRTDSRDAISSLEVNSLFPHRLSLLCGQIGARLVHMSTDCVFSGSKGMYLETDFEDAADLYGRSKLLGEVDTPHSITLRTSIIGLELSRKKSLIEWFLAQRGSIKGYSKVIYSGFTTIEMARIIEMLLLEQPTLSGVWHVASAPISKFDLLVELATILNRSDIEIEQDDTFVCDRSLDASQFGHATGYHAPNWHQMLGELAEQIQERNA
jgi:dTDP-4-dehydrorhamnose reductase